MKRLLVVVFAMFGAWGLTVGRLLPLRQTMSFGQTVNQCNQFFIQIEKTDAALRINRGRVYNEILDLFYAMNARLAANKVSAPKLVSITSDFDQILTQFRDNYNEYDDALNDLIKSKCQDAPGEFYSNLDHVRTLRSGLNDNIQQLDQLLNDYQNEFNNNVRGEIDG